MLDHLRGWAEQGHPSLPWLPGPLLDALAPLGIEVPHSTDGRNLARLLVGLPSEMPAVDVAVDAVRQDALATPARPIDDEAALWEAALRETVNEALAVLVSEYAALGDVVVTGDRQSAVLQAEDALGHVTMASTRIADLAVQLVGARPSRLGSSMAPRPPATLELGEPWEPSRPHPPRDRVAGSILFLAVSLAAALLVLWAVLNGRWPQ